MRKPRTKLKLDQTVWIPAIPRWLNNDWLGLAQACWVVKMLLHKSKLQKWWWAHHNTSHISLALWLFQNIAPGAILHLASVDPEEEHDLHGSLDRWMFWILLLLLRVVANQMNNSINPYTTNPKIQQQPAYVTAESWNLGETSLPWHQVEPSISAFSSPFSPSQ